MPHAEVERLIEVMHTLRQKCPWDAEQTHESLMPYLVEETLEVVEAVEDGSDAALVEELGDLLLQVAFHAEIAAQQSRFDIDDVARGIADKLVARHPHVFASEPVPDDMLSTWEQRKRAEKGRTSALDGIPGRMSALTRAAKVIARSERHGLDVAPTSGGADLGQRMLALVAEAHAEGLDAEQLTRAAVRDLERRVVRAESES
ncbi:MazG family protein [Micropruina sp.]|uniref:MazG family protein n=1 Tax=Micropruina sp. TaxID=2737536 RepID=UPI002632A257|nr:MazG family protein [Micropruina sp.]